MKNLLASIFRNKQIKIKEPEKFPSFHNVSEWMDEKVAYQLSIDPNKMDRLFNPSSRDYIPYLVAIGTSQSRFKEHLEKYREIKKQYPDAVIKAKSGYNKHSRYPDGDPEDYPN